MRLDDSDSKQRYDTLRRLQDTISGIPPVLLQSLSDTGMQEIANTGLLAIQESLLSTSKQIDEITRHQLQRTKNIESFQYIPEHDISSAIKMQLSAMAQIEYSAPTKMLETMQHYLRSMDLTGCIAAMSKALSRTMIEAADISFIQTNNLAQAMEYALSYPKGVKSSLAKFNVGAAKRLARSDDISYETTSKRFVVEAEPKYTTSVSEMNVICSGAGVLDRVTVVGELVTESEFMKFMSQLEESETFASSFAAGKKILAALNNIADRIGFNKDFYYHGRKLDEESCPFTEKAMATAPYGMSGPGRYNRAGISYYYFANTKEGVAAEIKKHCECRTVQIAEIRPIKTIKMIDLSGTMRGGATFLKYIRYPMPDGSKKGVPREYLIPNYVSDCCRRFGIDGIKYYGGKGYSNYVCWEDGFFETICMEIVES